MMGNILKRYLLDSFFYSLELYFNQNLPWSWFFLLSNEYEVSGIIIAIVFIHLFRLLHF